MTFSINLKTCRESVCGPWLTSRTGIVSHLCKILRNLSFSLLDHRIVCRNKFVGCPGHVFLFVCSSTSLAACRDCEFLFARIAVINLPISPSQKTVSRTQKRWRTKTTTTHASDDLSNDEDEHTYIYRISHAGNNVNLLLTWQQISVCWLAFFCGTYIGLLYTTQQVRYSL